MTKTFIRTLVSTLAVYTTLQGVFALSPTVYVDSAYTQKSADNHTFGVDAFPTIQEAVNAVEMDGIVYVKPGTYKESITISKSLSLSGVIDNKTVGASSSAPTIDGGTSTAVITIQGVNSPLRVSVSNFHITGGNHGILVVQRARVLISNNTIDGYIKNGITLGSRIIKGDGIVSGTIFNNYVRGSGPISTISQNGIQVAEQSTAKLINNTVINNIYLLPGIKWATGILIHNTKGVTASGNILINNQAGINILQATNNVLEGNTFIGNNYTNAGIMVTDFEADGHPASNNTINKNTITGGFTGIWASYTQKNKYTNNVISNTTQYAINLWDTDSNTVSSNTISFIKAINRGGYAISLNGGDAKKRSIGSSFNYVTDNVVTDSDNSFYSSNESIKNITVRNKF